MRARPIRLVKPAPGHSLPETWGLCTKHLTPLTRVTYKYCPACRGAKGGGKRTAKQKAASKAAWKKALATRDANRLKRSQERENALEATRGPQSAKDDAPDGSEV